MPTGIPTPPQWFNNYNGYTPGDHLANLSYDVLQWEVAGIAPTQLRTTAAATVAPQLLNYVIAKNLGFNVPIGATVVGILTKVNWQAQSATPASMQNVALFLGGAIKGVAKTPGTGVTVNQTDLTLGGLSDLWGNASLTPAMVNDPTFGQGVQIHVDTTRVFINSFAVAVCYLKNGILYTQMVQYLYPVTYRSAIRITTGSNGGAWVFLS